jgi:pyruvate/2-oxoglutarate dehydrogenase complex dihydrolipoamide dehydrogenase (E3) component
LEIGAGRCFLSSWGLAIARRRAAHRGRSGSDRSASRVLGAQIVGAYETEVSKRVDIFATAIHHSMTVESLNDLDLM